MKELFVRAAIERLSKDRDMQATVLGVILSALVAAKLDWGKLLHADPGECGQAAAVVVIALLGKVTNAPSRPASAPAPPESDEPQS